MENDREAADQDEADALAFEVAFLPSALLADRWRSKVFSGEVPPSDYNRAWWGLCRRYQGAQRRCRAGAAGDTGSRGARRPDRARNRQLAEDHVMSTNATGRLGLLAVLRRFTANLRYPQLFLLTAALFVVNLVVPDPLPFVDEILLGLLTLLLARLKDRRGGDGGDPGVNGGDPGVNGGGRRVKNVTPRG